MKRWILVTGMCAMLAASAQAMASGRGAAAVPGDAAAKRGGAGDLAVSFDVKKKHGKTKVSDFNFGDSSDQTEPYPTDLPLECSTGGHTVTYSTNGFGPMKVKNGKFDESFHGNGGSGTNNIVVKIEGKLTHQGTASGTVRIRGDYPPDFSGCDSGKEPWSAVD